VKEGSKPADVAEDLAYNLAVVCCQKHGCMNAVAHSRTAMTVLSMWVF